MFGRKIARSGIREIYFHHVQGIKVAAVEMDPSETLEVGLWIPTT